MHTFKTSNAARAKLSGSTVCRRLKGNTAIAGPTAFQRTIPLGQMVFREGDSADHVYEVVRGTLKLFKLLIDGRRQITGFLSSGRLLGLAHDECYLYTAEAIAEVVLSSYPRTEFDRLIDKIPGFARRVLAVASDELRAGHGRALLPKLGGIGSLSKGPVGIRI